jgi:hypothetical protein
MENVRTGWLGNTGVVHASSKLGGTGIVREQQAGVNASVVRE